MFPTTIYDVNVRLAQCHLESRTLFTSLSVRSREIFVRISYLYRRSTLFAYITTIMYKSLGTHLHLCGFFFQFTHAQPLPPPHKQRWMRVGVCPEFFRLSTLYRMGGWRTAKKFRKGCPTCIL